MNTNTTIHLTPPKGRWSPKDAPEWHLVPDAGCPKCGCDLETNGIWIQCKNYIACFYKKALGTVGRRVD